METPVFFNNGTYRLFGVVHIHEKSVDSPIGRKRGMIFCHPFAEEKLISHRTLVNLARGFTEQGIYCMRFDEMGHGDSEGNFEESTVETRLSDITCAINYFISQTGIEQVCLIGIRFGATMAALACADNPLVESLILISPIIDGKAYIDQCLRSNLTTQMTAYNKILKDRNQLIADLMNGHLVNIDGYLLGKDLYQQIGNINLLTSAIRAPQQVMLVQISQDVRQPFDKGIENLFQRYRSQNDKSEIVAVKEDQFWKDVKMYTPSTKSLQNAVMNWFQKLK